MRSVRSGPGEEPRAQWENDAGVTTAACSGRGAALPSGARLAAGAAPLCRPRTWSSALLASTGAGGAGRSTTVRPAAEPDGARASPAAAATATATAAAAEHQGNTGGWWERLRREGMAREDSRRAAGLYPRTERFSAPLAARRAQVRRRQRVPSAARLRRARPDPRLGGPMAPRSPGAPTLVLIPTALERDRLAVLGGLGLGRGPLQLCGFGPVSAAARTAALVERFAPRRVVMLGIAGTYDEARLPLGEAAAFGAVALDGVGAGEGGRHLDATALGFPQWAEAGDRLELRGLPGAGGSLLVTACAASATREEAERRIARFPEAAAEDMETFGAALACALAGVPLACVRGISNRAGDRDRSRWRVDDALDAARSLALELLDRPPEDAAP